MLSLAIRASLEPALNVALRADPRAHERLRAVQGKVVRAVVKELPESITLAFHAEQVSLLGPDYDSPDALVELSLFDLPQLTDAAEATHAIQRGKIKVKGDPILLQRASLVFKELDIDWEELLAGWFGDVPGYMLSQQLARAFSLVREKRGQGSGAGMGARVQEILVDEVEWLASPVHLKVLREQVELESQRVEALAQRLASYLDEKQ